MNKAFRSSFGQPPTATPSSTTTPQFGGSPFGGLPKPTFTIGKSTEVEGGSKAKDAGEAPNRRRSPTLAKPKDRNQDADGYSFPAPSLMLESPWRAVKWTEEHRAALMKSVGSYKPSCPGAAEARVLLLGPVGSGKSSFISSVQSAFRGRVTNRAMVGSFSTGFTKKLQFFQMLGQPGEPPSGLVLCDTMALGEGAMAGLTLHDVLSVVKGHVPEGHRFSPDQPAIPSQTLGYVNRPGLKEKIHCVAFVLDASKVSTYPNSLRSSFLQLREHISDLGVHQVALLTHVDRVCPDTAQDVAKVYQSCAVRREVKNAAALLGMAPSYIVPVKNYSSELDVDVSTDVLLLEAVDHILQYADLYFQDLALAHDYNEAKRSS